MAEWFKALPRWRRVRVTVPELDLSPFKLVNMNTGAVASVGNVGLHRRLTRPIPLPDNMADDLEKQLHMSQILQNLPQGKDLLTFEEILDLMGMDDKSLMTKFERESMFVLNKDMLDKLDDPDVIEAMVESLGKLKH